MAILLDDLRVHNFLTILLDEVAYTRKKSFLAVTCSSTIVSKKACMVTMKVKGEKLVTNYTTRVFSFAGHLTSRNHLPFRDTSYHGASV